MLYVVKNTEYRDWLHELKRQIKTGQIKAALSVNSQMIMLYWDLGRQISEIQKTAKWGSGFVEQLSKDLREEFPDMSGFSKDNLLMMKRFFEFYSNMSKTIAQPAQQIEDGGGAITAQLVQQLQVSENQRDIITEQLVPKFAMVPWGHHTMLLRKVKDIKEALFYINETIQNNWSRAVLDYQIETNLYERQGKAITNFKHTLPEPQSDLANAIMKDPYNFDFLQLSKKVKEIGR